MSSTNEKRRPRLAARASLCSRIEIQEANFGEIKLLNLNLSAGILQLLLDVVSLSLGKTVIMTTQVTNEGSNMSVYEVGKKIKREFGLLEAYDMTLEAAVTKIMWILTQTREPEKVRELFYQTVNHDILWKSS